MNMNEFTMRFDPVASNISYLDKTEYFQLISDQYYVLFLSSFCYEDKIPQSYLNNPSELINILIHNCSKKVKNSKLKENKFSNFFLPY